MKHAKDFLAFVEKAPTSFHAAHEIALELAKKGFEELNRHEKWSILPGKKYFIRNRGTLAAFITPKKESTGAVIFTSHTDSPTFKLKPKPDLVSHKMAMLTLEVYGGPLYNSWINRDLSIAGHVAFLDKEGHYKKELIHLKDLLVTIPQLAIHIDRDVNEKGLVLNAQEHIVALLGQVNKEDETLFVDLLKKELKAKELLAFDLFLVPSEKGQLIGHESKFIASYRIDNLATTYALLHAFKESKPLEERLNLAIFFDHEEFGSNSDTGAHSPFLGDLLQELTKGHKTPWHAFKANSLCLSLDLAHAVHPSYNKHDPKHGLQLNGGVVVKTHANGRYATSAETMSYIAYIASKWKLPLQKYVGRSDIPAGSTVGPIIASTLGIATVDLGLSQLSMHSARELMGSLDVEHLYTFLKKVAADEEAYSLCYLQRG